MAQLPDAGTPMALQQLDEHPPGTYAVVPLKPGTL